MLGSRIWIFFEFDNDKVHQYIFYYKVYVNSSELIFEKDEFCGIELDKDLIFKCFFINDLKYSSIKPNFLKDYLIKTKLKSLQFISSREVNKKIKSEVYS